MSAASAWLASCWRTQFAAALRILQNGDIAPDKLNGRSAEHTSELQSLMRISYAVFCLKKKSKNKNKKDIFLQYDTNSNIQQRHHTLQYRNRQAHTPQKQ